MSFLSSTAPKLAPWKVLLVDDEPDIHDITKLTLSRFRLDGRSLSFLHAYSGAEAKDILADERVNRERGLLRQAAGASEPVQRSRKM